MYSGEKSADAPERMDTFLENSQSNWEQDFLDISLKDEPLDIMDCHVNDVKSESEDDACVPIEPEVKEDITELDIREVIHTNSSSMIEKTNAISNTLDVPNKNSNNISKGEIPVTRKVIINGQPKTCILVNNLGLKQSIMENVEKARKSANNPPSPIKSSLNQNALNELVKCYRCTSELPKDNFRQHIDACPMVKCSRCGSEVHIDDFRQHIDACPPKKTHKLPKGSAAPKTGQHQIVQAMYNPSTGEVVSLNNNTPKSIVQIPKNVGKITESTFASSKEPNTNSQNFLANNGSCFTNVRSQSNNVTKAGSDISSALNNSSEFQCMRTSLQPMLNDYSTSTIDENSRNIQAPCANSGCNESNVNCSKKTKLYCNRCDFSSSTLLIMNIHMKKHAEVDSSTLSVPHRPFENIETLSPATRETTRQIQNLSTSTDINSGNSKSCSGLTASTNVVTIWKSAMRDPLLVSNSCTLTTDYDESLSLTDKHQLNPLQPQQHHKDRDIHCLNLNGQGNGDEISFMRPECEQGPCEQNSENTLQDKSNIVLDNLRDTIATGRSNNAKPTSEPVKNNQQVLRITRSKSVAAAIGVSVRTRSKSFSATAIQSSGDQQVITLLRRTRSKSVYARKCAEIPNEAADSSSRSVTTTRKCFSTNEDQNPTNLSHEIFVGRTRNHLTRTKSVLRDFRKSVNIQEDQGTENLEVIRSSKNSHNAEPRNRNESVEEETYDNVNLTLHCHNSLKTKSRSISHNLCDTGKELSKASPNSSSDICNTSGNSNIEYVNVTDIDMDEYSPASNLLLLQNNTFSCSVCSFTTDKRRILTDHERNHRRTNLPIFQCVYCSQRYTRYSLYLHIQDVHPGQKFQIRDESNKAKSSHKCSSCSFSTNNREELLVHTANHSVGINQSADKCSDSIEVNVPLSLNCSICAFSASDQRQLTLHLANIHPLKVVTSADASGLTMFCCEYCSYQNTTACKVSYHFNSHKNNRRIKKCLTCPFKSTPQALFGHMQKCPSKTKSDTKMLKPKGSSKCPSTIEQVKLKENSVNRILISDRQFFNCGMCSYGTSRSSDMRNHVKAHKNNPVIMSCQNCNFKSTATALKYHVRKCNKPLNSTLVNDGKGVSESKEVRNDPLSLNDQTKPSPFKRPLKLTREAQSCSVQKCSSKSKSLTKRLKPKRSSKYSFSTTEQVKLKLHKKEHGVKFKPIKQIIKSGRPFLNCGMCSYGTSYSSDFRCHVKTHENNPQIINCLNCNFKSTAAVLKFHGRKCNKTINSAIVSNSKGVSVSKEFKNDPLSLNVQTKPIMPLKSTPQAPFCPIQKFSSQSTSGSKLLKPKRSYKCSKCSFSTTGQLKLTLHKKTHMLKLAPFKRTLESGRSYYNCRMCSYETLWSSTMRGHVKTHQSNPLIMNCLNCNFKSTAAVLKRHVRKCKEKLKSPIVSDSEVVSKSKEAKIDPPRLTVQTKPIMVFKCTKCSFFTSLRIKLKLHIRKRHLKSQSVIKNASSAAPPVEGHRKKSLAAKNNTDTKCTYCSFDTTNKWNMSQHMRCHKSHEPMKQCPRCSFKSTPNALKNHLRGHNTNHGIVKDTNRYQCSSCSFVTKNQYLYSDHMKVHKGNKAFKCRVCSLACSTPRSLKLHMNSHKQAMESCPDCNFKSTPTLMRNHICGDQSSKATHSDDINSANEEKLTTSVINKIDTNRTPNLVAKKSLFQCSLCPFSTSLRIKLNVHSKKYHQSSLTKHFTQTDKHYQCSYCSYNHISKKMLIVHTKTHLKGKMHLNNFKSCDYASTSPALDTNLVHCMESLSTTNTMTSSKSKTNTEIISSSLTAEIIKVNKDEGKCLSNRNKIDPFVVKSDLGSKAKSKHVFTCELCSYTTDNRGTMDKHTRGHKSNPIVQCTTCSYRATPRALSIHLIKFHTPDKMQLTKNSRRVSETQSNKTTLKNGNEKEILQKEAANVTSPKVFNCPSCSFTSFWLYVIDRHIKSHTLLKLPIKQCAKCDFRSTPVALSAHTKACSGKTGASGSPPKNLELSKSDNGKKNSDLKACDTAGMAKLTNRLKYLKSDRSKIGNTDYTLGVSETESSDKDKNNTSSSRSPPNKALFSCPNCSFTTNLRIKLKFHLQKIHPEPETVNVEPPNKNLIPCKYCSYIPSTKFNQLKHERSHIINKPPIKKCSKCSFRSTRGVLRNHEFKCNGLVQA